MGNLMFESIELEDRSSTLGMGNIYLYISRCELANYRELTTRGRLVFSALETIFNDGL